MLYMIKTQNKLCTGLGEASTRAHWEHKRKPFRRLQTALISLPLSKHTGSIESILTGAST